jgi:hypothetical protein
MTTLQETTWTCLLCGELAPRVIVTSTNEFESSDLDLRPGEMKRSTMVYWVVRCSNCGFVTEEAEAGRIDNPASLRAEVESADYRTQLDDSHYPELANDFLCSSLLRERRGELAKAGWSALAAAWACDDSEMGEAATRCRVRAVELWRRALSQGQHVLDQPGAGQAVMADALRRAGRFEEGRAECTDALNANAPGELRAVLHYLLKLVEQGDSGRHTLEEARRGS